MATGHPLHRTTIAPSLLNCQILITSSSQLDQYVTLAPPSETPRRDATSRRVSSAGSADVHFRSQFAAS